MQCVNKGITCGGYGARLKWGNGVASRGYLTGATIPVQGVGRKGANGVAKGRKREAGKKDESREGNGKGASASRSRSMSMNMTGSGSGEINGHEGYKSGELVLDFGTAPAQNEVSTAESMTESLSIGSNVATPETSSTEVSVSGGMKLSEFDARLLQECESYYTTYLNWKICV